MSVHGNKPAPYRDEGIAQCLANIRRDVAKLRAIFGEDRDRDAHEALVMLGVIEDYVNDVEKQSCQP